MMMPSNTPAEGVGPEVARNDDISGTCLARRTVGGPDVVDTSTTNAWAADTTAPVIIRAQNVDDLTPGNGTKSRLRNGLVEFTDILRVQNSVASTTPRPVDVRESRLHGQGIN
jgi:hypothetical protein